jgi:hypothetical protein
VAVLGQAIAVAKYSRFSIFQNAFDIILAVRGFFDLHYVANLDFEVFAAGTQRLGFAFSEFHEQQNYRWGKILRCNVKGGETQNHAERVEFHR